MYLLRPNARLDMMEYELLQSQVFGKRLILTRIDRKI